MAYLLDGSTLRRPNSLQVSNDTQMAQNRTLDGSITRDMFGSNKKVWELNYVNTVKADFDTIDTIYQSYLSSGTVKTWEVTETNYTISQVNVHVDLKVRSFSVGGESYISDFTLILTEA